MKTIVFVGLAALLLASSAMAQIKAVRAGTPEAAEELERLHRALVENAAHRFDGMTPEEAAKAKAAEKAQAAKISEALAMQKMLPAARQWVGVWSLTNERGGLVTRVQIRVDGVAIKPGEGATAKDLKLIEGKWLTSGGAVRIAWKDGTKNQLKAAKGKTYVSSGWDAGAKYTDEPTRTGGAAKEAKDAPLVEPKEPAPGVKPQSASKPAHSASKPAGKKPPPQ
jgi:hypothetical protein